MCAQSCDIYTLISHINAILIQIQLPIFGLSNNHPLSRGLTIIIVQYKEQCEITIHVIYYFVLFCYVPRVVHQV